MTRSKANRGMVVHQFPVRPNMIIPIELPPDLSVQEATRLGRFVESLAVDQEGNTGAAPISGDG